MTAARSASMPDKTPIENLPQEWDFRWVQSHEEADHVYLLELAREVIRGAELELTMPKQRKALATLVEAMFMSPTGIASRKAQSAVQRLNRAQFMVGVLLMYGVRRAGSASSLPVAYERLELLRSNGTSPRASVLGITKLDPGKPYASYSFSGEACYVFRIPAGTTAKFAKSDFALWADSNLPAGSVSAGGRPDLSINKLLRLAFYRFDQAWEHPRPYAGFAVAVQGHAKGDMARAFTEFGNRHYAGFVNPRLNKPKQATWTEGVSSAKAELKPLVAEVVAAAKSLG